MISIYFENDEKTVQVEANQNLSDICDEHPSFLLFGCREASCGTCLIEVVNGMENLSPITDNEQDLLDVLAPDNPQARLACQCVVQGDIHIRALEA
ncbi:MAG: 2Fe-2S iron-sulfur cluster-binding protein [Scytonema sp. PMC 1069.18]|nr:2Fe-2S iron-sulfur cluster-binding protein [Scytonema sp. PMC 1069.18]MEC4882100.1 2Fe-2S iron-sulfur cluster-binding protein [Scytonema sp. PMC 1070.18]